MKKIIVTALSLALISGADLADAKGKKIRKEADFNSMVVGKSVNYADGSVINIDAGKLSGKLADGRKVVGAWNWQGRFFCRNITIGTDNIGTDCQIVEIDGNQITFIRKKGRGERSSGTLK